MLDLNIVKQHLRLEPDITDDDELLRLYTGAAVAYVEQWTRRKLYMTREDDGFREDPDSLLLTDNVRAALLLLVAFWYENREPAGMGEISETPFAVEAETAGSVCCTVRRCYWRAEIADGLLAGFDGGFFRHRGTQQRTG